MGIGSSRGDDRAVAAAEMAISSPLLEASIDGAHGVLLSIQGGSDLGLFEINEAAQLVSNSAAVDANIIFGAVIDDALGDEVRVTVIAAGFDEARSGGSSMATAAQPPAGRPAQGAGSAGSFGAAGSFGGPDAGGRGGAGDFAGPAGNSTYTGTVPRPVPAASAPSAVEFTPAPVTPAASAAREGMVLAAEDVTDGSGTDSDAYGPAGAYPVLSAPVAESGPAPVAAAAVSPGSVSPGSVSRGSVSSAADEDPGAAAHTGAAEQAADDAGPTGAAAGSARRPHAEMAGKTFEVATSRRRPVVFEEDDDLDIPDFLK
jgi:cell division protein FtsZ